MTTETQGYSNGVNALSPYLICLGADAAIDFYKRAFDADELIRLRAPNGKVMHACVRINGSTVMLGDEALDWGSYSPSHLNGTPVTLHLMVRDADAAIEKAVAAGAKVVMPAQDMFWGDRYGLVEDPFGHRWSLAHNRKAMTADEIRTAMAEAFEQTCQSEAVA